LNEEDGAEWTSDHNDVPYMQKYCTGNECLSYEHKTMCTALCSLSNSDCD